MIRRSGVRSALAQGPVEITRYGNRNWAVWLDGELLAVTVYKKGATAVADVLTRLTAPPADPESTTTAQSPAALPQPHSHAQPSTLPPPASAAPSRR